MRLFTVVVVIGLTIVGIATVWAGSPLADPPPQRERSLLGILAEWKYPDSKMPDGASMSDGGNPLLQSVKCQAILTTADPVEKVMAFYSEKFEKPQAPGPQEAKAEVKRADGKSVSTQDDSRGRPVKVRVIVVNKAETSTTLVISRAHGEEETHIAWSHYIRLNGHQ